MSELIFVLNDADWPVLLLDSKAGICHRNPAAAKVFGPQPTDDVPPLAEIWSPDNPLSAEQFLTDWKPASSGAKLLKFSTSDGWMSFQANLSPFSHDDQEWFVAQLLPPSSPPEIKPSPATLSLAVAEVLSAGTGEANIAQKQRLECALQMARTVALDFNNALTSILGHTSLILGQMSPNHPWRNSLAEVEKSVSRAAEIANALATFSRQQKETRSQTTGNLNQLLEQATSLFKNTASDTLAWDLQLTRKLYTARFDEALMQQVFVKILENATQSIGPTNGNITILSRNLELESPTRDRNVQLAPGSYVCAEIKDNGCGIAAEILPRIFEPFFTTKKPPHRGLGLAWVYGVVTNHGGGVVVSSEAGNGTSVRIYLPAEKKFIQNSSFSDGDLKGDQTILLVDDEDLLLTMGQAILSSSGYTVFTANSGPRALEILSKDAPPIDLLITDLVMPGMDGRELVEQAGRVSPGTRLLFTSGGLFPGRDGEEATYLQKPFTSRELLTKVKLALAADELMPVD